MANIGKKSLVLIWGIIFTFLVLEIGLRVTGGILVNKREAKLNKMMGYGEGEQYTILCLGNCYTWGTGAPQGLSYPDHLFRLIKKQNVDKNVFLFNRGLPGLNTGGLLERLESNINELDPDLIILRTGSPNLRDHRKYGDYLQRKAISEGGSYRISVFARIKDMLVELHVVQLVKMLAYDVRAAREARGYSLSDEVNKLSELKTANERTTGWDEDDTSMLHSDHENRQLIAALGNDKAVEYAKIGDEAIKGNDYNAGFENYIEVAIHSRIKDVRLQNRLFARIRLYASKADFDKVSAAINRLESNYPEIADSLRMIGISDLVKWAASDLDEIVKVINNKGVELIIINYPVLFPPDTKAAQDRLLGSVADQKLLMNQDAISQKQELARQQSFSHLGGSDFRNFILQINDVLRKYAKENVRHSNN